MTIGQLTEQLNRDEYTAVEESVECVIRTEQGDHVIADLYFDGKNIVFDLGIKRP